jgi:hypothetical protein
MRNARAPLCIRSPRLLTPGLVFPSLKSRAPFGLFFLGKPSPLTLHPASASAGAASSYSLFLFLRTLTSRNQEERSDSEVRGRGLG